jgi:hypothetical protein
MEKKLTEVIHEAIKDSDFLEAILSDADQALAAKDWTMTSDDRRKLGDMLNNPQISDPGTVLRAFNSVAKGNAPWEPPPWSPYYPDEEEMN